MCVLLIPIQLELLLTSACTFFKASILIQRLLDELSELAMSASCKKQNVEQNKLLKWI